MIISASRRTDIPSFYGDWLIQRIKEGVVVVCNPYNPKQQKTISLRRQDVTCFVFWTKNAIPFMAHLENLHAMGYPFYFLYTITAYKSDLERGLPSKNKIINNVKEIASIYGSQHVVWRYDPILFTNRYNVLYHIRAFTKLSELLHGYTNTCIISFLEYYRKLRNRPWPVGFNAYPAESTNKQLLEELKSIASKHNIQLSMCCNYSKTIPQLGCINENFIQSATGTFPSIDKDRHQRTNCQCLKTIDIGRYSTCKHKCMYCYA